MQLSSLIPEHFHHPKKKPYTCAVAPSSPTPQSFTTTNLLSVFMDLPILDILYKWIIQYMAYLILASYDVMIF